MICNIDVICIVIKITKKFSCSLQTFFKVAKMGLLNSICEESIIYLLYVSRKLFRYIMLQYMYADYRKSNAKWCIWRIALIVSYITKNASPIRLCQLYPVKWQRYDASAFSWKQNDANLQMIEKNYLIHNIYIQFVLINAIYHLIQYIHILNIASKFSQI